MTTIETVTVSPKFQIVIPSDIRKSMGIQAGERLVLVHKNSDLHLIPVSELKKARGLAKGVTSKGIREEHDRIS